MLRSIVVVSRSAVKEEDMPNQLGLLVAALLAGILGMLLTFALLKVMGYWDKKNKKK